MEDAQELLTALEDAKGWLVVASRNALPQWGKLVGTDKLQEALVTNPNIRCAAIGKGSAETLSQLGVTNIFLPRSADSTKLLLELKEMAPADAVLPLGNLSRTTLENGLSEAGWKVYSKTIYINSPAAVEKSIVRQINSESFSGIVLRSPSAATVLNSLAPNSTIPVFCGGPITAEFARELAMNVAGVAKSPSPEDLADLVACTLDGKP